MNALQGGYIEHVSQTVAGLRCSSCAHTAQHKVLDRVFCEGWPMQMESVNTTVSLVDGTQSSIAHRMLSGMTDPANEVACTAIEVAPLNFVPPRQW